jgi:hypothetical protein
MFVKVQIGLYRLEGSAKIKIILRIKQKNQYFYVMDGFFSPN